MDRHGRLDILVNHAGIAAIADVLRTTTEIWRRTLAVHLDDTFFGCRHAIPTMERGGGGSIINISPTAARMGISPYFAYSATKGAIHSLTKSVAVCCREGENGIRCNSVHPGSIDTPMVEIALEELRDIKLPEHQDRQSARAAIGLGEPNDVAYRVLFLTSNESKHVTGAEPVVDHGNIVA